MSLKHSSIIEAATESGIMVEVLSLIEKHPWNNMVQLKAHNIFQDVFDTTMENQQKFNFVHTSKVTQTLVRMGQTAMVNFASGNRIRNGYMGFVIQLANVIVKQRTECSMDQIEDSNEVFDAEWDSFVSGELESSNEQNKRNLGGRPTSATSTDDEPNHYDVNMDNIMKRFKCFNNIMQNNSSTDEDDKEEEDMTNEPDAEGDDDQTDNSTSNYSEPEIRLDVTLPEPAKVDTEFSDSGFWKDELKADEDLDDLLADYE